MKVNYSAHSLRKTNDYGSRQEHREMRKADNKRWIKQKDELDDPKVSTRSSNREKRKNSVWLEIFPELKEYM
jgi:hypothetical protein